MICCWSFLFRFCAGEESVGPFGSSFIHHQAQGRAADGRALLQQHMHPIMTEATRMREAAPAPAGAGGGSKRRARPGDVRRDREAAASPPTPLQHNCCSVMSQRSPCQQQHDNISPPASMAGNMSYQHHHYHHPSRRRLRRLAASAYDILFLLLIGLGTDWRGRDGGGGGGVAALRTSRTWTTKPWCESVESPDWPFAYSKYANQSMETKGRTSTNKQDMRHECAWWGVQSKCHRCEKIACSTSSTCHYQIQGVPWTGISTNVPTVNDAPWAVNGSHRYDFGGKHTTHVCLMLSGGHCLSPFEYDYTNCTVRCWGHGFTGSHATPQSHMATSTYGENVSNPGAVDAWAYPKKYPLLGNTSHGAPVYNPQGYAVTVAGGNGAGYRDGPGKSAKFNNPQGVAVDAQGHVYVADTANHRIRRILPNGTVSTVAGTGKAGHHDGFGYQAEFSSPSSLAVWYDDTVYVGELVLYVADTDNHRIRRIDGIQQGAPYVSCFAGQCGNGTSSYTETLRAAPPRPGYADGEGDVARFDGPRGVAVTLDGWVLVADTNNHLIRQVSPNGTVETVAGNLEVAEADAEGHPLPGCEPPCLKGVRGHRDGNLTYAQFNFPSDVAVGLNHTIIVTDQHRVRMVTPADMVSQVQHVYSSGGRVATLAGQRHEGQRDGEGDEAQFSTPEAVTVSLPDGAIYVADALSCRIRRLSSASAIAETVNCSARFTDVMRPSGCQSYDPPVDLRDKTVSPVFGNIHYNYRYYANMSYVSDGFEPVGRTIHPCVGSPPPDLLDKRFWNASGSSGGGGGNLVVDDGQVEIKEETGDGTTIRVHCTSGCTPLLPTDAKVRGDGEYYTDDSFICQAAIHAGIIDDNGGLVLITLQRGRLSRNATATTSTLAHSILSTDLPYDYPRLVTLSTYPEATVGVQTIAGHPAALLEEGCGMRDGQPPQEAMFNMPSGVGLWVNATLNDSTRLYVADTKNHRVVAISAVCSFPCENMGRCVGPDKCECPTGWTGHDCTKPDCSSQPCGSRQICVAPDTCACVAGYTGAPSCLTPLCVQTCRHGGNCVAPDTCDCAPGWFDANCTTPVCGQTCGNGGNCTSPNLCSCPQDWTGVDCRIPTCKQTCQNGGWCTAPNTCTCPPQWSGHDCSLPVCMQGYMLPDPVPNLGGRRYRHMWQTYVPCTLEAWCNSTNGFDCRQKGRQAEPLEIPSGPFHRNVTGRSARPPQCTYIELQRSAVSPYPYVQADNSTTPYARYTPLTPYDWDADPKWPWSAYDSAAEGRTEPWNWMLDRQVAFVELRNVTQGPYVCANKGNCTAPDVCRCAPGWSGFDCRTPVCTQGYYVSSQDKFVSGSLSSSELSKFSKFMGNNTARLDWPYSNPNYTLVRESYINTTYVQRYVTREGDARYLGGSVGGSGYQGGYYCSIRAHTEWENPGYVLDHPNFWSRYMDPVTQQDGGNYTAWWDGMDWLPVHYRSPQLRFKDTSGQWFSYTDQGYRLDGVWITTGAAWQKGTCITEMKRVCPGDGRKGYDLHSQAYGVNVQDTDISYRPRMNYTIWSASGPGRWFQEGGECVDHVLRGCYNNGTCVGPDTCQCAEGWTGHDCSVPICTQACHHNGNCTLPNTCTCEKGWRGADCTTPVCAQECNNGGRCVAPDTCLCNQWPSEFRDGYLYGGRPLFRKPNGDPQNTGWTGYDCSTPICTQAKRFILNIAPGSGVNVTTKLGGHGKDAQLTCSAVRCPAYNTMVTENDGQSFQTGCGYDPLDTGCCYYSTTTSLYTCYICDTAYRVANSHNFTCLAGGQVSYTYSGISSMSSDFIDDNSIKMCGKNHNPSLYYKSGTDQRYWSGNANSNYTSDRYLCNVLQWEQGDWLDDGGLDKTPGMGTDYGLDSGRHVRINDPNITMVGVDAWKLGDVVRGEGIYECYNGGSCVAPDVCTCADGWGGFDCNTPLCRHRQVSGETSSCQNGGVCVNQDDCHCIQTLSVLSTVHPHLQRGVTGWSGTDCSMPMCTQGYYDPFCTDLPQAPGNEGCYRCANGGNCTAPDFCECAKGWTGYDCRTPVCEVVADELTRKQLATVDEEVVDSYERNPCSLEGVYVPEKIGGVTFSRGNCTAPNECSCLCKVKYSYGTCLNYEQNCLGPWQDPMVRKRNVLPGPNYCFGTRDCADGYEGNQDRMDRWTSCHLTIYVPSFYVRYTRLLITVSVIFGFFALILYLVIRRRLKRQYLLAKIERRRSRRSSEESAAMGGGGGKNKKKAAPGGGKGGAGAGNLRARGNAFRSS